VNNYDPTQLPPSYFDPATSNPYSHDTPPPVPLDPHTPHVPPEPHSLNFVALRTLNDRHKMMAEFQVMGWTQVAIAREFGLSIPYVWKIQQDPVYKLHTEELRKRTEENAEFDIKEFIAKSSEKTWRRMYALQDSEDEKIAIRATENFADRQSPKINKIDRRDESVIYMETNMLGKAVGAFMESLGRSPKELEGMKEDDVIDLLEENVDKNIPEPRKI